MKKTNHSACFKKKEIQCCSRNKHSIECIQYNLCCELFFKCLYISKPRKPTQFATLWVEKLRNVKLISNGHPTISLAFESFVWGWLSRTTKWGQRLHWDNTSFVSSILLVLRKIFKVQPDIKFHTLYFFKSKYFFYWNCVYFG